MQAMLGSTTPLFINAEAMRAFARAGEMRYRAPAQSS